MKVQGNRREMYGPFSKPEKSRHEYHEPTVDCWCRDTYDTDGWFHFAYWEDLKAECNVINLPARQRSLGMRELKLLAVSGGVFMGRWEISVVNPNQRPARNYDPSTRGKLLLSRKALERR